jgi:dTDP-4-dehydrorhamnose 3,5-epimerase
MSAQVSAASPPTPPIAPCEAIAGVFTIELTQHRDHRGAFTELHRETWISTTTAVQWNAVVSKKNTLRGVHTHIRHADYLTCPMGNSIIGLKDLRRHATTYLKEARYELSGEQPRALYIPPGVAHGFYFPVDALQIYSTSVVFDPSDELAFRWDDPATSLFPEVREPLLSPRDAGARTLDAVLAELEPYQDQLPI